MNTMQNFRKNKPHRHIVNIVGKQAKNACTFTGRFGKRINIERHTGDEKHVNPDKKY